MFSLSLSLSSPSSSSTSIFVGEIGKLWLLWSFGRVFSLSSLGDGGTTILCALLSIFLLRGGAGAPSSDLADWAGDTAANSADKSRGLAGGAGELRGRKRVEDVGVVGLDDGLDRAGGGIDADASNVRRRFRGGGVFVLPDTRRREDELDAGEPVRGADGNRDDDTLLAAERALLALTMLRSPSTSFLSSASRTPFPFRLGGGRLVTCDCGALDPGSSVSVSLSDPERGRGARRPYVLRTRPDNIAIVVGDVMHDLALS